MRKAIAALTQRAAHWLAAISAAHLPLMSDELESQIATVVGALLLLFFDTALAIYKRNLR